MAAEQFTLTNSGTGNVTINSVTFNNPIGIGHTANLVNLGGSSTETGNATLFYPFSSNSVRTFTVEYNIVGIVDGIYAGNIVISGSNDVMAVINSTITVGGGGVTTTTTTTAAPTPIGTGKAIFGFGFNSSIGDTSITNLVSNTGVVATDTAGVGTGRYSLAASGYGS